MQELNELKIGGLGRLTVTVKGTRRYDDRPILVRDSKTGLLIYQGLPLLDPGIVVAVMETPNIICNEGLQLAAGFFIDESAVYDVGITYCELGTGSTTPVITDTALTTYHGRKAITSRSRSNYVDTFSTFWVSGDCTAEIEEVGVWGGSNAAAGEATGLLFAHWLSSYDNSGGNYDLTFDYVLTIGRV